MNHGRAVHLHDGKFALPVAGAELPVRTDACIVDQQIHDDPAFFGEGKDLIRRIGLVKVRRHHLNPDAYVRSQCFTQLRKPLAPPRREHEMRTAGRQFLSQRPADAGTGAGYQRPFSTPAIGSCHCP